MSSTLEVTVLSGVGTIAAALIAYLGARFQGRSARRAQDVANRIERDKVEVSAYSEARKIWDSTLSMQRSEIHDLREQHEAQQRTIHLFAAYVRDLLKVMRSKKIVAPPCPEGVDITL